MRKTGNIKLTDDPLTNICIMTPLLNDEQRKAFSYLMLGCRIGEELAGSKEERLEKIRKADSNRSGSSI